MSFLLYISNLIVPAIILGIVTYGILMKVNVYDEFIKGAKKGFGTVIQIMPTLIGLMVAVGVLRASGFLDFLSELLGKILGGFGISTELLPLALVKMVSSSAATGLLLDLYKQFGNSVTVNVIAAIAEKIKEVLDNA